MLEGSILCSHNMRKPTPEPTPLFPQSHISSSDFNIAFLSLVKRHNLTYSCQTDMLRCLSIILPTPNFVPSSSNCLITKFVNFKMEAKVQHFCGCCTPPINPGASCANSACVGSHEPRAVFVRVPLSTQLANRFEGTCVLFCIVQVCYSCGLFARVAWACVHL